MITNASDQKEKPTKLSATLGSISQNYNGHKYFNCIVLHDEISPEPEGLPEGSGDISLSTLT